jgi:alpha-D-ribose 1-methylphosphonate 5-triphosphate synthase subunit PhnG
LSRIRLSREERWALLAAARPSELIGLADTCLGAASAFQVVVPPQVGCVSAQVREPILRERFLLGDVLACSAEVELDGHRGWALRFGDDRAAVLAMAIVDAAACAWLPDGGAAPGDGNDGVADEIDRLCDELAGRQRDTEAAEWAELAPTVVEFEEL